MSTETKDAEVVDLVPASAIELQTRGEVDIQVTTARRFPRSLATFKKTAMEMATLDEDTADSCIYALPRDGKTIEGPSARLAEILASAYGHMRIEGRPIGDDGTFIRAQGRAWDIQNNVAIAFETQRRATDRHGKRFKDDMIMMTANAATSIALRNAILKVIPKAFWGPIYEECKKVAVGTASTLADRRTKMLAHFQKMGVTPERVFAALAVKGAEDITLDHMATLKGLATAIKEGDTTVDEAFGGEAAGLPQPAQRKSQQGQSPASSAPVHEAAAPAAADPPPQPQAAQPTAPAAAVSSGNTSKRPVGQIVRVLQGEAGTLIKLDTGFQCATRDDSMIHAAQALQTAKTRVELVTIPPREPRFAPVLQEILPLSCP